MKNNRTEKIIIGVLTVLLLSVGSLWFFDHSNGDNERKRLLDRNERLEEEKSKIKSENEALLKEFNTTKIKLDSLKTEYESTEKELNRINQELAKDRHKSEQNKKERERMRLKIDEIKSNPIKRTGENLLESIKSKTSER